MLPASVRVARWAELAFVPLAAIVAIAFPMPGDVNGWIALVLAMAQPVAAFTVFRFLPGRSRAVWTVGMLLAVFVLSGLVTQGPALFRAFSAGTVGGWSVAIAGWQWLCQAVALVALLASTRWVHERR